MKISVFLIAFVLAFSAWAEELERFPGWKINKIEPAEQEEGAIQSGPDYYGLTPPDKRPPVTIDARTARALKVGQATPEEVYGRLAPKNAKANAPTEAESYEYSAGNNGYVQAETISSTLPGYMAEAGEEGATFQRGGGDSFGSGATGSYGGSSASMSRGSEYSASSSSAGHSGVYASNKEGSYGSRSGEGGMSHSNESTSGPSAAQSGAKEESAQINAAAKEQAELASRGLNVKSGFEAIGSEESGSKKSTGKGGGKGGQTNRTLASEEAPPPPCPKGRFVYDKGTYTRLKLPDGCGMILIRAWGAGGGSGFQSWGGSEAENAYETSGGGASFMSTSWEIDARKYDLIVVVGEPGASAKKKTVTVRDETAEGGTRTVTTFEGGAGGFPEGKNASSAGGGGGGFSGVFLAPKGDSGKALSQSRAMAVASGGSGGAGGGAGGAMTVPSSAPNARMTNQIGERGNGSMAGFHYYSERGSAGSPGNGGKVVVEYY